MVRGILNLMKNTVYSSYYLKQKKMSEESVVNRTNRELLALKELARHRGLGDEYLRFPLRSQEN